MGQDIGQGGRHPLENADDRETSMAMHILVASVVVGAHARRLSEYTGYEVGEIRKFETNLREAGLWVGEFVDDREWQVEDKRQMKFVLFLHAEVARGLLQRRQERDVAVYRDHASHDEVRIPIPPHLQNKCGAVWMSILKARHWLFLRRTP